MKKSLILTWILLSTLVITGCGSSKTSWWSDSTPLTPYEISDQFAEQFKVCETNPSSCDLNRDAVIEGTISKIYEPNIWDFSNFVDIATIQWATSTIPLLPDTQQKRSTIIVDASGESVAFEDIVVWDTIKASVKSFDIIEAGQVKEKLGQYGYIQITAQ